MVTKSALRMIRGKGESAVTHYDCGVVEQAKEDGVQILVMRRNTETGKMVPTLVDPRMVHRPDLPGVYADTHELAGQGKYIALAAYLNNDPRTVVGAQHVNPYLREDAVYATILEVFKKNIGKSALSRLCARLAYTRRRSHHLLWEGKRTADGFVVASEWMTEEQIWTAAQRLNPELLRLLRKSKSGREDVNHKTASEKFATDLDVVRRATCTVDAASGIREFCGGATPYAYPLEQCGSAIDKRWLTCDVVNGEEVCNYYYRLAIGRPEPHPLSKSSWSYEGAESAVAFLNQKVRAKYRASA